MAINGGYGRTGIVIVGRFQSTRRVGDIVIVLVMPILLRLLEAVMSIRLVFIFVSIFGSYRWTKSVNQFNQLDGRYKHMKVGAIDERRLEAGEDTNF